MPHTKFLFLPVFGCWSKLAAVLALLVLLFASVAPGKLLAQTDQERDDEFERSGSPADLPRSGR